MAKQNGGGRYKNPENYRPDSDMISSAIANKKKASSAPANRKKKKKKKSNGAGIAAAVTVLVLVLAAGGYVVGWATSVGKFLPNTYINDIDVSKMTLKQAVSEVQITPTTEFLTIKQRGGKEEKIPLDYFDYSFDIYTEIKEAYDSQNYAAWLSACFEQTDIQTKTEAEYDAEKLEYLLRNTIWGSTDTQNARLAHGDAGYYVQSEVYGDTADIEVLVPYVMSEVERGNLIVDLTQSGCYSDPTVFAEDLQGKVEEMNQRFNFDIVYDFDYTTETLSGYDVYEWMRDDGSIDRSKVENYVKYLSDKYNTFMTTRHFTTTDGRNISIDQGRWSTGQYGWWIDEEKTVEKLLEYIDNAESITTEPMYVTLDTGYCYEGYKPGRSATSDIGDTYIEIDLSAQHLWYYKNGVLDFETTQIVSGKATDPSRKTPGGIYSVYTKAENYTMKAADGSYSTKCSYFMRISFEGIGLHDLSRGAYGGQIYINNGSHGCINMKYSEVQYLYNNVERGTPVVLYY